MMKVFALLQKLQYDLEKIEYIENNLSQRFSLLNQYIKHIFSVIKSCEKIESVHCCFDLLVKIQSSLAILQVNLNKLLIKEGVGKPDHLLSQFIKDFDRIDDKQLREYIFNKIKSGEYYFGKKLHENHI